MTTYDEALNGNSTYDKIMGSARRHVADMDRIDGSVAEHPIDLALRTVMSALEYAMTCRRWDGVGDAQVMLGQIEIRYRSKDVKSQQKRTP